MSELLDRLERAVMLESADAAIRFRVTYQPQAGPTGKVFPPTYIENAGEKYHFERRWDPDGSEVGVVLLDSVQSQAARAEASLVDNLERLGLPVLALDVAVEDVDTGETKHFRITNLDAPHRSRDAYFIDSLLEGERFDKSEIGRALLSGSDRNATPFLRYAPTDLIFGVWDSHRGKRIPTKFARAFTSEIVGWDYLRGRKGATKTDPLALKGNSKVSVDVWRPDLESSNKKAEERLSELGHGMIPVAATEESGGVAVRSITRLGVMSLTSLARYHFPLGAGDVTRPGRATLAAVGLVADRLAFAGAGLHLRSGSDLVMESESVEWVQAGGGVEPMELTTPAALELFDEARERLASAGLEWDPQPILLTPASHLSDAIANTYLERTLEDEE